MVLFHEHDSRMYLLGTKEMEDQNDITDALSGCKDNRNRNRSRSSNHMQVNSVELFGRSRFLLGDLSK